MGHLYVLRSSQCDDEHRKGTGPSGLTTPFCQSPLSLLLGNNLSQRLPTSSSGLHPRLFFCTLPFTPYPVKHIVILVSTCHPLCPCHLPGREEAQGGWTSGFAIQTVCDTRSWSRRAGTHCVAGSLFPLLRQNPRQSGWRMVQSAGRG